MMARKREITLIVLKVIMAMMVFEGGAGVQFEMFQLVEQWPPAYCATHPNDCNAALAYATTRFTIHGYWPSHEDGTTEVYCPANPLDPQQITNLRARLDREWITFRQNWNNLAFWTEEWRKHGSCSGLDQARYFETALHFKEQYDIFSYFGRLAPTSNFTNRVTIPQLQNAIYQRISVFPAFYCTRDPSSGYREITEVVLCVTRGGPTSFGALRNCSDDVTEQTCSFNHTYFWSPMKPPRSQAFLGRFFELQAAGSSVVMILTAAASGILYLLRGKLLKIFHGLRTTRAPVKED